MNKYEWDRLLIPEELEARLKERRQIIETNSNQLRPKMIKYGDGDWLNFQGNFCLKWIIE